MEVQAMLPACEHKRTVIAVNLDSVESSPPGMRLGLLPAVICPSLTGFAYAADVSGGCEGESNRLWPQIYLVP
jgi:hypothetical protein